MELARWNSGRLTFQIFCHYSFCRSQPFYFAWWYAWKQFLSLFRQRCTHSTFQHISLSTRAKWPIRALSGFPYWEMIKDILSHIRGHLNGFPLQGRGWHCFWRGQWSVTFLIFPALVRAVPTEAWNLHKGRVSACCKIPYLFFALNYVI